MSATDERNVTTPPGTKHGGGLAHERPEVKTLVEKAGAKSDPETQQGVIKTGSDVPGGGSSHPHDLNSRLTNDAPKPSS